ncbi:MAG: glycosyltransferase family 25 protein [Litoreibacter sp.]
MTKNNLSSFVIHLDRAQGRKNHVARLLECLPNAEVLDAVDGRAMSVEEQKELVPNRPILAPRYPFKLRPTEIGCFASHRAAWQQIVDRKLPYALIFEDDAVVDPVLFEAAIEAALCQIGPDGYIQFQVRDVKGSTHLVARGAAKVLRPMHVPLRASAQLVSFEAAQTLLAKSVKFDRPVDTWLQMVWETGVEITCVWPSGVTDQTEQAGGTTIGQKRGVFDRIRAEILRPLYRRKISALSQKHWPY